MPRSIRPTPPPAAGRWGRYALRRALRHPLQCALLLGLLLAPAPAALAWHGDAPGWDVARVRTLLTEQVGRGGPFPTWEQQTVAGEERWVARQGGEVWELRPTVVTLGKRVNPSKRGTLNRFVILTVLLTQALFAEEPTPPTESIGAILARLGHLSAERPGEEVFQRVGRHRLTLVKHPAHVWVYSVSTD